MKASLFVAAISVSFAPLALARTPSSLLGARFAVEKHHATAQHNTTHTTHSAASSSVVHHAVANASSLPADRLNKARVGVPTSTRPTARRVGFGMSLGLMRRARSEAHVTRDAAGLGNMLARLSIYRDDIVGHSYALDNYANQSKAPGFTPPPSYQTNVAGRLTDLHSSLGLFTTSLHSLAAKKGMANYDKSSELEKLLKDVVNAMKYTMDSVDCLVYEVPFLGPILGPIVYEIKCVLDDVLNAVENVADGLLNKSGLRSTTDKLNPLIHSTMHSACKLVSLNGLCVGF